jgi:hypothetical protein
MNPSNRRKKRTNPSPQVPSPEAARFYRRALDLLVESKIPFLVGGAYAFARYTGINRDTCDFDVFVSPEDAQRTLDWFAAKGYHTRFTFPHWLGKIYHQGRHVDIIFSSGNGIATVDRRWFEHATPGTVLDRQVMLIPAEEMIWSKSFIMERERFDGADVLHLIRACDLDWGRLLKRFGPHWRVLYAHLVLFPFVFPAEQDRIPRLVLRELGTRITDPDDAASTSVCRGTLVSREQYLPDLKWGYEDARLREGTMSREQIAIWTAPIAERAARVAVEPARPALRTNGTPAREDVAIVPPAAPLRDGRRSGRSRSPDRAVDRA